MLTVGAYSLLCSEVFYSILYYYMTATTLDSNAGRVKRITRLVEVLPVKFQDEIERQSRLR